MGLKYGENPEFVSMHHKCVDVDRGEMVEHNKLRCETPTDKRGEENERLKA